VKQDIQVLLESYDQYKTEASKQLEDLQMQLQQNTHEYEDQVQ